MKKIVLFLFIISTITILTSKDNTYVIPSDAIRFRIIANSNRLEDQIEKNKLKNEIQKKLEESLKDSYSAKNSRGLIVNDLSTIKSLVSSKTSDYDINYGYNYFPEKTYKNVVYPAGEYESLVITLGSGLGNNWWCVLYPPLCFIDEEDDVNYDFYVKEIFNKIKSN